MARFSAAARSAGAGSTSLPLASLYSPAGSGFRLREVGVFNTTSTEVAVGLARLTTAGTQGAGLTEVEHHEDGPAPVVTGFQTHSGGPTIGSPFRAAMLGGAFGSGVIWTFLDDVGIYVPSGTANGVGIIVTTGTGQVVDFYFTWDE